ncbi:hypothetical protein AGR6A_Lc100054 [Agrobacterium sp. NCPPB 925]|nr:hypothetical protein AGR6A_Lc100054 [Agrobacterium sp. NCPPB 925]
MDADVQLQMWHSLDFLHSAESSPYFSAAKSSVFHIDNNMKSQFHLNWHEICFLFFDRAATRQQKEGTA